MNTVVRWMGLSVLLAGVCGGFLGCRSGPAGAGRRISGPYTHKNLTIFLLHGADRLQGFRVLTMDEALAQKKLVVYETEDVNQLEVENQSEDEHVYIQSGQIVKGGKQDRTLNSDCILPPLSGRRPIDAFCVEHARWGQRGDEEADTFGAAYYIPYNAGRAGNILKYSEDAEMEADQAAMWEGIEELEEKLSDKMEAPVAAEESPSSLQLMAENKELEGATKEYIDALSGPAGESEDAIGMALVINGEILSVDVYGSHELFLKLWPTMLRAFAQEAFAEYDQDAPSDVPTAQAVETFMENIRKGEASEVELTDDLKLHMRHSDAGVNFKVRLEGAEELHEGFNCLH